MILEIHELIENSSSSIFMFVLFELHADDFIVHDWLHRIIIIIIILGLGVCVIA